jgi:AraC-like DNA-binding protein
MRREIERTYDLQGVPAQRRIAVRFLHIGRMAPGRRMKGGTHPHGEHEWLLVTRGRVRYDTDHVEGVARKGELYCIQPGQSHREELLTASASFYFLTFELRDTEGVPVFLFDQDRQAAQRLVDEGDLFLALFRQIYDEARRPQAGSREIIEAVLVQMVWAVQRRLGLRPHGAEFGVRSRQRSVVQEAKDYLAHNLHQNVRLRDLARHCGVSGDHLWHLFKRAEGVSPLNYALNLRMTEASRLLENTDLAVYQVATSTGFRDSAYFCRRFKKATGLTPEQFRRGRQPA